MKIKFIFLIALLFFLNECAGMGGKRSEKSDEFLIEKKNPLVMPPDIDELPKPSENVGIEKKENDFKDSLKSKNLESQNSKKNISNSIEESIIKKIEN